MAAVSGELSIHGINTYRILEFEYEMYVDTDELGRPNSRLKGAQLIFDIVTPPGGIPAMYEWLSSCLPHDGFAVFDSESSRWRCSPFPESKVYSFSHAYCIDIREYFNSTTTSQMCARITIQPGMFMPCADGALKLALQLLPSSADFRKDAAALDSYLETLRRRANTEF